MPDRGDGSADGARAGFRVDVDAGIATVTLDRPERLNAVALATWDALRSTFESLALDPSVRVVMLTGAGTAFCAGADVKDPAYRAIGPEPATVASQLRRCNAAGAALHHLPKPTIAAVNGVACGAGWSLALSCDLVMAAESARFAMSFVDRGLTMDLGATWLLARSVGAQRAKHLAFTGAFLTAQEAQALGLVLSVHPDDALDRDVAAYAARLLERPAEVLTQAKAAIDEAMVTTFEQSGEREAHAAVAGAAARLAARRGADRPSP